MKKYFWIALLGVFILCSMAQAGLIDNGDGTVTDTITGLMWQQEEAGVMTWEAALAYCENLELPAGKYTDWRLPNRNELQSLVDYSQYGPAIDIVRFPEAKSSNYWSSTTFANSTDAACYVYFDYGYVGYNHKSLYYYVRAVRSGQ